MMASVRYSVVSNKGTGCNKQTGWSKNFIQYMKKDQGGKKISFSAGKKKFRVVKNFKINKQSCSLNRYYRRKEQCATEKKFSFHASYKKII